ncbi:hypothetical protein SU69_07450 [Thermosipho melanesiensis]|uniref:Uncharacterized protein n=1 Tax=Thermosipho melanesiensis TaxID=46541 RepID=A0ABM6GHB8_9BACT|nr:hypothetical protein [Thermosipho melanesiensis]APT74914.1 hypothetical protein BW47_07785 [Thermosipho melanesiensis]OOC36336.1 hypothetical protein SU68_07520 [Thermosipho melanesiensis]OOC37154.1 hypothetical protein SU69_07450 [Thermosipho melanesiensis]OOC37906.1 hypothetical protein SU70_07460 [Thermosipho melanesiensis]OOC41133.1 hypothetical protein SU71_07440 [Thermosipho melanesiensis]
MKLTITKEKRKQIKQLCKNYLLGIKTVVSFDLNGYHFSVIGYPTGITIDISRRIITFANEKIPDTIYDSEYLIHVVLYTLKFLAKRFIEVK